MSTAVGVGGGEGPGPQACDPLTQTCLETLINNGLVTANADAEATTLDLAFELVGAARLDSSTGATVLATGISGSGWDNEIVNAGGIDVDATSTSTLESYEAKWKGFMIKGALDHIGLNVGDMSTTAASSAIGVDGGGGNDSITNTSTASLFDVYGKAEADSTTLTLSVAPPSSGGSSKTAAVSASSTASVPSPQAQASTPPGAAAGANPNAYANAATVAIASTQAVSGGDGNDTIKNQSALKSEAESSATSLALGIDVSLKKENKNPIPGAAVVNASTSALAASVGVDAGSGDNTIENSAALDSIAHAKAHSEGIGVKVGGSLEGFVATGLSITDTSSQAISASKGISSGLGGYKITNSSSITAAASSRNDADSISVTAGGVTPGEDNKVGIVAGVSLAWATSHSGAFAYGIDAGYDPNGASPTPTILGETVENYGSILADANSTTSALSVATIFSAAKAGVVAGASAVSSDATSYSSATGIRTGHGADKVLNAGGALDQLRADATATSSSNTVAVTVSAAWKGVALAASLADSSTEAEASAVGIEANAGDDTITNRSTLASTATSEVDSDTISIAVAVAPKGVSAGVALSRTETNSEAEAIGIHAGDGDDTVTNRAMIDVDATAITETDTITINFAELGAAIADASSEAKAEATGVDSGNGVDSLTNSGWIDVSATAFADDLAGTANFLGYAKGEVESSAIATATGVRNQAGPTAKAENSPSKITNRSGAVIKAHSLAKAASDNYVVNAGGALHAEVGGTGSASATGVAGGAAAETVTNESLIDASAQADVDASNFTFALFAVQEGSAGVKAEGMATGVDGGGGEDVITNAESGAINAYANVDTLAANIMGDVGGAKLTFSGTTARAGATGIRTGEEMDTIENRGSIDVTAAALGQAGTGSIGMLSLIWADALARGSLDGIDAAGGADHITNSGTITVGQVRATDEAIVKSDAEAASFDFFSFILSTPSAGADIRGIASGDGDDTITNTGSLTVGDSLRRMVVGESFGYGGQWAGSANAFAAGHAAATSTGIDAGDGSDTIENASSGTITVDASSYSEAWSETYEFIGFLLPSNADSIAKGTATAEGVAGGKGNDYVENAGTVQARADMLSFGYAYSDMPIGLGSNPMAESEARGRADAAAVDLGEGRNEIINSGSMMAGAEAAAMAYAGAESGFNRTYADVYTRPVADASGLRGGDGGNIVTNTDSGSITALALARTADDVVISNVSFADADEESTLVTGAWDPTTGTWIPATASASGVLLGSGDDIVSNDGTISAAATTWAAGKAHSDSWTRNTWSEVTALADATARGIAAGAGDNVIVNRGKIEATGTSLAHAEARSWSRDYTATALPTTSSTARAIGVEADGDVMNASEGTITAKARAWTYADANTEAETATATETLRAEATGVATVSEADPQLNHGGEPVRLEQIRNDGEMTVTAVAGEGENGNMTPLGLADTDTWVRSCDADNTGTSSVEATGIRSGSGHKEITNTGEIDVLARARAHLQAHADSRDYWPNARAHAMAVATATGMSVAGDQNWVTNEGSMSVEARVEDAYSQADTWAGWHTCHSWAETEATATATGISAGDGDDTISNQGALTVLADADAESFAWADTRDNNLGDEYEDTKSKAVAEAVGIDAGAGANAIHNSGELEVKAVASAWAHAGGGHATVTGWDWAEATVTGIKGGDEGSLIHNAGTIDVLAMAGAGMIQETSAVGIQGGAGDDTIINEGTIKTGGYQNPTGIRWLWPVNPLAMPGVDIAAGGGNDHVWLSGSSVTDGVVHLGTDDDVLHLAGSPIINGSVRGGDGADVVRVEDTGHHHLTDVQGMEHIEVDGGTLEIHHDYSLDPGGRFQVRVNGDGSHGELRIDGEADLDGEMVVRRSGGAFLDGTTFDVLSAPTVDQGFASFELPTPTPLLSFSVNQLPTVVQVQTSVRPFRWVAHSKAEAAVARYMESLLPQAQGDLAAVLGDFQRLSSSAQIEEAFGSLSPHAFDDCATQAVAAARQNSRAIHRRMVDLRTESAPYWDVSRDDTDAEADTSDVAAPPHPRESPLGVWIGGLRENSDQDGHDGYAGFDSRTNGIVFGADQMFEEQSLLGASLSLASTDIELDADRGDFDIDSTFLSLYGTWFDSNSYLETILAYGRHDTDSVRHIRVGETMRQATGDPDSYSWSASGEAGLRIPLRRAIVEPFGGLSYVRLREESFQERGAGSLDMSVQSRNTDSLQSELGLRLYPRVPTKRGLFIPELTVAWSHDFDIDDRTVTTIWAGAEGASFSLDGRDVSRDGLRLEADLRLITRGGLTSSLNLRSEMRHRYTAHSALIEVGLSF
jgi:uncharacterized protein YhjY with autotransporter beta-barrel domain